MLSTDFSGVLEASSTETIDRQMGAWRDSLIDLTRRNPLLALPESRQAHLALPGLTPGALHAALSGRRPLLLVPATDAPDDPDAPPSEQAPSATVRLSCEDVHTLQRLRRRARRTLQDQSIPTLYAAMGVLEWPDPQMRGATLCSPLLLMPVTLDPVAEDEAFTLRRFDDEVMFNPALRLRCEQGIFPRDLPQMPQDEPLDAEAFLESVREAVTDLAGCAVTFDCLISRFSPQTFALYQDLAVLAPSAQGHPLVSALAGDREALRRLPAVTLPAPSELDAAPEELYQVLDADPAQREAMLAARRGQSFVLHGPPGTGKSQTIANILADSIAQGRRVLFVSHKAAALDAVATRLRDRGLATFCLEAHGTKATKKHVLEQLRAALEARAPEVRLADIEGKDAKRLAAQLNQTGAALHAPRLPLGCSVYEANGIVAALPEVPDLPFVVSAPDAVTRTEYRQMEDLAERLAACQDLLTELSTHPWRGIRARHFDADLQSGIRSSLAGCLDALGALGWEAASLANVCHLAVPQSVREADRLLEIVDLLRKRPPHPLPWLTASPEDRTTLREEAQSQREQQGSRRAAYAALREDYDDSLFDLPVDDLEDRLDERHEATLLPAFGSEWPAKVSRSHDDLDRILMQIWGRIARVRRAMALLAESLGLPPPETIAASADLLRVAALAANLRALPAWLEPGALPRLIRRCAEARTQHESYLTERADVTARYAEGIFLLDLPAMHARFSQDYNGPLRFLNAQFHIEMRVLRSVAKGDLADPSVIVQDLASARTVLVRQHWITMHEPDLEEAFGSYYEGVQTDWDALTGALQATKTFLAGFPEETIPTVLPALSGVGRRALMDRLDQGKSAFAAFGETLREFGQYLEMTGLPFTDQPLPHAPLTGLASWAETLREAAADYVAACRLAMSARRAGRPLHSVAHLTGDIAWAAALHRAAEAAAEADHALRERFGAYYHGDETDWDGVLAALAWTESLYGCFPDEAALPEAFADFVQGEPALTMADLTEHQTRVRVRRDFLRAFYVQVQELFPPERLQSNGHALETLRYEAFGAWLRVRLERLPDLERWIALQAAREECERLGLLSFFETLLQHRLDPASVLPAFRKRFHRCLLDSILDSDAALRGFRGKEHEARIARFAALDARRVEGASEDVRALGQARRPAALFNIGEAAVLRAELNRKRQTPIRTLLGQIPNLLSCLKPCLLMSPVSVSVLLDPERIGVDLVIFDEASQIPTQEAIGALLRGSQVIIAGDRRQLPPAAPIAPDQSDADPSRSETGEGAALSIVQESILDAADVLASEMSPHFARRALTWHYRSGDESLIAFSRRYFYPFLKTFPAMRPEWALAFEHVPTGVCRGGANVIEAMRVADLVAAWARSEYGASLGVVTFGEAQRDAIEQALAGRFSQEPDLEALLDDGADGFFVKTVESAQGDQRDVIFLSVGYGPASDGVAAQRFGPLDENGGERFLNVAITRARRRCVVVSSLLPSDIVSDRAGTRLLREYLDYARSEASMLRIADPLPPATAFEQAIETALTARGHRVRRQVGISENRVLLAVVDPSDPARCCLGIECDGPAYQDIPTASERDRCRAEVLRGLGWHLVRIWSSDWVRDPASEIARIEAAICPGEIMAQPGLSFLELPRLHPSDPSASGPAAPPAGVTHYERACPQLVGGADALFGTDGGAREDFLCSLVGLEGPLAVEAAAQRLASAAGLTRADRRVSAILEDTIDAMIEKGILEQRDSFLWTRGGRPPARVPRGDEVPRPLDQVALEEIGEVALAALRSSLGMRREELIAATAGLLGDRSARARTRIGEALALLELDNRVSFQGGKLRSWEV